ncbi:MAG: helix-turn-helix domain-containing protein [Pirellulales bacterium]
MTKIASSSSCLPHAARGPIAHTWAQVAQYFEVSERTVARWIVQGMPGTSGRPGTREGMFPLHDIEAWREGCKPGAMQTGDETLSQAQARLVSIRAQREELALGKERDSLVDLTEMQQCARRLVAKAEEELGKLPSDVARLLPPGVDPKHRARVRKITRQTVEKALVSIRMIEQPEPDESTSPAEGVEVHMGRSRNLRAGVRATTMSVSRQRSRPPLVPAKRKKPRNTSDPRGQFARFLRAYYDDRKARDGTYTQQALAAALGISVRGLRFWLKGDSGPAFEDLDVVAAALGYRDWGALATAVTSFCKTGNLK